MSFSPIVSFIYSRPDKTRQTLEALSKNILAESSELFIFADGPKQNVTAEQLAKIAQTRAVAKEKSWCGKVTVIEREKNYGLTKNILSGITDIVNKYGKVIVVEDDIVTDVHFLEYMNDALVKYKDDKKVWHVGGCRVPVRVSKNNINKSFFYPFMAVWGWATWADRWQYYNNDADFFINNFTEEMINRFNVEGSAPMWNMILDCKTRKLDTWDIFWYGTIQYYNGLCLSPYKSLVKNIGFDSSGEHCSKDSELEIKKFPGVRITEFPTEVETNWIEYNKEIKFYTKKYKVKLKTKITNKLIQILHSMPKVYKIYKTIKNK